MFICVYIYNGVRKPDTYILVFLFFWLTDLVVSVRFYSQNRHCRRAAILFIRRFIYLYIYLYYALRIPDKKFALMYALGKQAWSGACVLLPKIGTSGAPQYYLFECVYMCMYIYTYNGMRTPDTYMCVFFFFFFCILASSGACVLLPKIATLGTRQNDQSLLIYISIYA